MFRRERLHSRLRTAQKVRNEKSGSVRKYRRRKIDLSQTFGGLIGLTLYPLDLIQYRAGGGKVPDEEYLKAHADLLREDEWIIDGYGSAASAWERFAVADTLVYIDLPLFAH